MKHKLRLVLSIVMILLLSISFNSVDARLIWMDDFEDGDLEGWTISGFNNTADYDYLDWWIWDGDATVEDGVLKIAEYSGEDKLWTILEREHSQQFGTWSFDWDKREVNVTSNWLWFLFESPIEEYITPAKTINESVPINGIRLTYASWGCLLYYHSDNLDLYDVLAEYRIPDNELSYEGWEHYDIARHENNTFRVYHNQELVIETTPEIETYYLTNSSIISLQATSGTFYDNITFSDWEEETDPGPLSWETFLIGSIFAAVFMTFIWRRSKKKLLNFLKMRKVRKAQSVLQTFSDIFTPSQLSYLAVLGQSKLSDLDLHERLKTEIPSELKDYRFLMHPIRLSIMKILYKSFSLTSVDIKHAINVSWGEYANHISALEKRGFVSTQGEFVDGNRSNVIYLEDVGRREYEELVEILKDFLKNATHDFFDKAELYPEHQEN